MVVQEENHKSLMYGREDRTQTAAAFVVMFGSRNIRPMTEKVGYNYCGKFGHDGSTCYELVGCPPSWENQGRGRNRGREGRGVREASSRGCGPGREVAYAAATRRESEQLAIGSSSADEVQENALPGLTNDQIQKLLSRIESTRARYKKLSGNDVWIFDISAS